MEFSKYYGNPSEKPLDNLVCDGGFCKIFRTIGCIGDSLSSGEFESKDSEGVVGYHDFYEYSWGQFMARTLGSKVYNFSRGGMTAKEFVESFCDKCGVYDYDKLCQCYIIALGVNDITRGYKTGNPNEINISDKKPEDESILGYISYIMRVLKSKTPDSKFFLVTIPYSPDAPEEKIKKEDELAEAIRKFSEKTKNTYVIDLRKYAPAFDEKFKSTFFKGHMTPAGYVVFAQMIMSYIDYIIRNNHEDFSQVGFIGTPYKYIEE